jgi:hypothetical protein
MHARTHSGTHHTSGFRNARGRGQSLTGLNIPRQPAAQNGHKDIRAISTPRTPPKDCHPGGCGDQPAVTHPLRRIVVRQGDGVALARLPAVGRQQTSRTSNNARMPGTRASKSADEGHKQDASAVTDEYEVAQPAGRSEGAGKYLTYGLIAFV